MEEIIYLQKNSLGYQFFTFPQKKERYSILLFGYNHNLGEIKFPFKGAILSFHMSNGKFIQVGKFFVTENKNFIVLAFDELGFIYGKRNENKNYFLIDEPPIELINDDMKTLEIEYLNKKLDINSELHYYTLR